MSSIVSFRRLPITAPHCDSAPRIGASPSYGDFGRTVQKSVIWRLIALAFVIAFSVPAGAQEKTLLIVALGDSLTAGYGLPADQSFPAKLERALRGKGLAVEVQNAGVSGDTASAGLGRLDWSVPENADAVIVSFGANDALRAVDPKVTRTALDAIIRRLQNRNIPILIAGMRAPRNLGKNYTEAFDAVYPELTTRHGTLYFPFFLEGVAAEPSLNLPDGLHPNAKGVDLIVRNILPKVEELIARARTSAKVQ